MTAVTEETGGVSAPVTIDGCRTFLGAITDAAERKSAARAVVGSLVDASENERQEWRDMLAVAGGLPKLDFDRLIRSTRRETVKAEDRPRHSVNVTGTNPFRYDMGRSNSFDRAVYEHKPTEDAGDLYWLKRADLPFVHARVIRRDGSNRRTGTDYLISGSETGARVIVTDDDLATGVWAVRVGIDLSSDRVIIAAAGTAVRHIAYRYALEAEATARPDVYSASGHLDLPVTECLPDGYFRTPPQSTEETIRAGWVEIAGILAGRGKMALAVAASAFSPFVGPLRRQSHWFDMHGVDRQGKSTTLAVCAAVWGDPRTATGMVMSWNATGIGSGRHLGQLGILPVFMDERGMSGYTPAEWGEHIYTTCQGNSRLTSEIKGTGTRRSAPWAGVLFATGNGRLTEGCEAGRFAGIPARVIALSTPFTLSGDESDRICRTDTDGSDGLVFRCYGWLGAEILRRFTVTDARALVLRAEELAGKPAGGRARTISEHIHGAIAGAMMVDAVLGTGSLVTDAALECGRAYITEHDHTPETDADRMLVAISEAMGRTRAEWPSEAQWSELGRPRPEWVAGAGSVSTTLAAHGYAQTIAGITSASGQWAYVFPSTWKAVCAELGCDSSMALAELHKRGALHVPESTRREGKWTARPKVDGKQTPPLYQISQSAIDGPAVDDPSVPPLPIPPADVAPVDVAEPVAGEPDPPAVCSVCGQRLMLIRPDRTRCARCDAAAATAAMTATAAAVAASDAAKTAPAVPEPRTAPGASPRPNTRATAGKSRSEAQRDRLAADIEKIDQGKKPRMPHAFENEFLPRVTKKGGGYLTLTRRPSLPGCVDMAHVATGWTWHRDYAGETVTLDRSGAYVAAASSVSVALGELVHTADANYDGRPGYYQVQAHPWLFGDSLPNPLGDVRPDTVLWIPQPTMARLHELAEQGRYADATVLDSWTGDPVRIREWAGYVNALRSHAIRNYGRADGPYPMIKEGYSQALAMMKGSKNPGRSREWSEASTTRRPDIAHAIESLAAMTMHRWADDCAEVAPEFPPVMIRNTDELVIPREALAIVTTTRTRGRKPLTLDPAGILLGSFKEKS